MKAINTRSFEEEDINLMHFHSFILFVKGYLYIVVRFKSSQNTLNILREKTKRVYWIYVCKMFTV